MVYIVITISIIAVFLFTRLFSIKKEVHNISQQLQKYTNRKTNKKIDIALMDKDIEKLGIQINKLMDMYVTEHREKIRFEMEQKQAVANISHDLRTPLTSILGYIQMAEAENVELEEKEEFLSIAKQRAKRLEALLNDFFELSVIESAEHKLKSERININRLVVDTIMSFYDRFNEKNLEPIINIPKGNLFIIADESAVSRVVENLISNAIKHSDGNIIISLEEKESTIMLSIKNDAYTLTKQDVERIFDRFYMVDQSRSDNSTGLGLSIVKSFMDKMNGTIASELVNGQLAIRCEWEK
nr:HAMP domain-containing sensor histidine kinase [Ornithinibacillus halotolerans]